MKNIRCDLPSDLEEAHIHFMSDQHIGDSLCDFNDIMAEIKEIEEDPAAFVVLNGDILDTAISSSVGDTYGATISPMEQLRQAVKIFTPIAKKVICLSPGNHEDRIYKTDGISLIEIIASQLGIRDRYTDTSAFCFVRLGQDVKRRKICYRMYVSHGTGGGRRPGGKLNRLSDLALIADADIYVCGHTHLPAAFRTSYYRVDDQNSSTHKVDKLFINTAARLSYDGGYGDKAGFTPPSTKSPILLLNGKKREAQAVI